MFNTKQKYVYVFFSALNPAVYCLFTLWAEECDLIDLSMKHKTKLAEFLVLSQLRPFYCP